jgi:hypothetical protein
MSDSTRRMPGRHPLLGLRKDSRGRVVHVPTAAPSRHSQLSGSPCCVRLVRSAAKLDALAKYMLVQNRYATNPSTV